MFNSSRMNHIVSIICLGLALLILVIPITEMHNIQITVLLVLYFALDKSYLLIRALFFFLASIIVCIMVFRSPETFIGEKKLKRFVTTIVIGLLVGLIIFYGASCCDTPVIFFMGFPFSWLRGVAPVFHYLPEPPLHYLLSNIFGIHWYVDAYSLIIDVLFWSNFYLLAFAFNKVKMPVPPKGQNL